MLNFVHVESKRLKLTKSTRRRFSSYRYGWSKHEHLPHFLKLIYSNVFIYLTILACLNQPLDESKACSERIVIRVWDIWYAFVPVLLLLSLFVDYIKQQNIFSFKIFNTIQISLGIALIILIFFGHIHLYHRLWWPSSIELTRLTLLSIIFLDICPISIAVLISIHSLKKRRLWRRVHARSLISNV